MQRKRWMWVGRVLRHIFAAASNYWNRSFLMTRRSQRKLQRCAGSAPCSTRKRRRNKNWSKLRRLMIAYNIKLRQFCVTMRKSTDEPHRQRRYRRDDMTPAPNLLADAPTPTQPSAESLLREKFEYFCRNHCSPGAR